MAKNVLVILFLASCLVGVALSSRPQNAKFNTNQVGKDWCVAQIGAPADKLQGFIDYACGINDCLAIQPGAPCFEPNNLVSHASFALDLEYRRAGLCNNEVGTITTIDPSHDACQYPVKCNGTNQVDTAAIL
ncbi:glucan endo-1,3-beta-glucosidase 7-like [Primulina eburnea]|uniref:glucan endo-1,3-beta-glucosidase 7-like n=1 Tax=Primulina eburnea TaxID=1245227 RepID=UPI003C6C7FEC